MSNEVPEYPNTDSFKEIDNAFKDLPWEAQFCDVMNRVGRLLSEDEWFYEYMYHSSILGRTCPVAVKASKQVFKSKQSKLYDLAEELKDILCQKKT